MRLGDYVVMASITLNAAAMLAYLWQGFYANVAYFMGAVLINCSLLWLR